MTVTYVLCQATTTFDVDELDTRGLDEFPSLMDAVNAGKVVMQTRAHLGLNNTVFCYVLELSDDYRQPDIIRAILPPRYTQVHHYHCR